MYYSSDILKIRESTLYNKNVKENVSIVGIGDIHISNLVGMDDINRISEVLYNTKADYICMLGDIIDSPYDMPYILVDESSDRYTALNRDRRTKTYEFRIFNSNLRIERVMKNLECVFALLDYTKLYKDEAHAVCDTYGFIRYVLEHEEDYPNLYDYFEERKIKDHFGIRYTEEELEAA